MRGIVVKGRMTRTISFHSPLNESSVTLAGLSVVHEAILTHETRDSHDVVAYC